MRCPQEQMEHLFQPIVGVFHTDFRGANREHTARPQAAFLLAPQS